MQEKNEMICKENENLKREKKTRKISWLSEHNEI